MRQPRLEPKCIENVVDLSGVEVGRQIVWPIAGALFVALWKAGHLIVIAVRGHEIRRAHLVRSQSRIAGELQRPRDLDKNILETGHKADAAVRLALAGDDGLRPIELG